MIAIQYLPHSPKLNKTPVITGLNAHYCLRNSTGFYLHQFQSLKQIIGMYPLVFIGRNDRTNPISKESVNQLIEWLGHKGRLTGHGFRHTMSTILHEQGFNSAWIETQLAHVDKNAIRGTYNHAQYLDGRREMMQWYADYIYSLACLFPETVLWPSPSQEGLGYSLLFLL